MIREIMLDPRVEVERSLFLSWKTDKFLLIYVVYDHLIPESRRNGTGIFEESGPKKQLIS